MKFPLATLIWNMGLELATVTVIDSYKFNKLMVAGGIILMTISLTASVILYRRIRD